MIRKIVFFAPRSGAGRKRLLLILCGIAIAVSLVVVSPWASRKHECVVTVRPGESIQAAVDAAEAGAIICLARGAWSENIVIDKPLTLAGSGVERTSIEAARVLDPILTVSGQGSAPIAVRVEGLTITGVGGGFGVAINGSAVVEISACGLDGRLIGIQVADSAELTLSDSTVTGHRRHGVLLSGSARAGISGCRISRNLGPGLVLSGSAEATLVDCQVSENRERGLWLQDDAQVALDRCSVSRNRGSGLWLTGRSAARLVRSSVSENWDEGVGAEDRAEVELVESELLSNWRGVELGDSARGTTVGCVVSENRWDGMKVEDSARATVSGSVISGNRRGVWVGSGAAVELSDCLIEANSGYGVFAWYADEVSGEGNEFRDNGIDLGGNLAGTLRVPLKEPSETIITWPDDRYASLQEAIDALLPGGRLVVMQGVHTAGLTVGTELSIEAADGEVVLQARSGAVPVLSLVDGAGLRVEGVTISGGSEGLLVSAGAEVVLVGCTISGNSQGILLSYSSSADMVGCNITGNERSGVFVGGEAQARIDGCSISNSGEYGIAAADSAHVTITDSMIARNRGQGGVVLWGSSQTILQANTIVDNRGFGVAVFQRPCYWESLRTFLGYVSGSGNVLGGNRLGEVCPPELGFLSTAEGGELDLRP